MEDRHAIVFSLFDVKQQGFIDKASLRLFFLSFFQSALEKVAALCDGVDEWVNGKKRPGETVRENGVPNHFFVGPARKKKFELAVSKPDHFIAGIWVAFFQ